MVSEKALFSVGKGLIERFKKVVRDKERNLKDFYLPYYIEVESTLFTHLSVITILNQEVTSCSYTTEEDMFKLMEGIEAHNNELFDAAAHAAKGKTIKDMAREVDSLVIKLKGTINSSLITSLEQYARDLHEADVIEEYHFLQAPCQNTLNLTRDFKANIPSVHSSTHVQ